MARLYQKINNEAVPLGGGGGGSVAIDNDTITENSDGEIQVATTLTSKINQLNNVAADMGKVLTANGNGTAEWDDILVPIDYETITKNSNGELQVSSMPYDNTESGLTADNVQDAIDEVSSDLTASDGLNFRFATDGEGNYGYLKADDSFVPFKQGSLEFYSMTSIEGGGYASGWYQYFTIPKDANFTSGIIVIAVRTDNNNYRNGDFTLSGVTEQERIATQIFPFYSGTQIACVIFKVKTNGTTDITINKPSGASNIGTGTGVCIKFK